MLDFVIILKCFVLVLITFSVMVFVGKMLFRIMRRDHFHNIFEKYYWSALLGLVLVVSIYAAFKTHGRTSLLLMPGLIFLLVWRFRIPAAQLKQSRKSVILFVMLTGLICFMFYLTGYHSNSSSHISFLSGDYLFYCRLAEYMNITGIETTIPDYFFASKIPVTPYHYGDLWTAAFVSVVFGISPELATSLVVYPLVGIIASLGIAGYVRRRWEKNNNMSFFLPLLFIFFSGAISMLPRFDHLNFFESAPANFPKALWSLVLLTGSLYFVSWKNTSALLVYVAIAAAWFINILPPLFLATGLWAIYCIFQEKGGLRSVLTGGWSMLAQLVWLYLFYAIVFPDNDPGIIMNQGVEWRFSDVVSTFVMEIVNRKDHLLIFLFLLLLLLSNVLIQERSMRGKIIRTPEIAWILVLIGSGFVCWHVMMPLTMEARQFYNSIVIPCGTIVAFLTCYHLLQWPANRFMKLIGMGLLILICWKNKSFTYASADISRSDWKAISKYFDKTERSVFVSYSSPETKDAFYFFNPRVQHPLKVLNYYFIHPYINEPLNVHFQMKDKGVKFQQINEGLRTFTSFYQFKKRDSSVLRLSPDQQMLSFIEHVNARYIVFTRPHNVPPLFRPLIYDSLSLEEAVVFKLLTWDNLNK